VTLTEFASIAEIVSAGGVIATLVFLAVELRKNTTATRQQSYHNIVSRRAALFREGISKDRETIDIFAKGLSAGDLDELDAQRFLTSMMNILSHFQDVYMQFNSGIVEYEIWAAERQVLAGFSSQLGFTNFWREIKQYYLPEFIEEMAKIEPLNLVVYDPGAHDWGRPGGVYFDEKTSSRENRNGN